MCRPGIAIGNFQCVPHYRPQWQFLSARRVNSLMNEHSMTQCKNKNKKNILMICPPEGLALPQKEGHEEEPLPSQLYDGSTR